MYRKRASSTRRRKRNASPASSPASTNPLAFPKGAGSRKNRTWPISTHKRQPWNSSAPAHSERSPRYTKRGPGNNSAREFRKSERNSSTSSAIRQTTPARVHGFSSHAARMPGSDFCWPQVSAMANGTGTRAHATTRQTRPATKTAKPRYAMAAATMMLHAAGGLGQPGHLARALGRARGEQLVNLVELDAGLLDDLADHGGDAELQVVVAQVVDDDPMRLGHLRHVLRCGEIAGHGFVPQIRLLKEAVLIHLVNASVVFVCWQLGLPLC